MFVYCFWVHVSLRYRSGKFWLLSLWWRSRNFDNKRDELIWFIWFQSSAQVSTLLLIFVFVIWIHFVKILHKRHFCSYSFFLLWFLLLISRFLFSFRCYICCFLYSSVFSRLFLSCFSTRVYRNNLSSFEVSIWHQFFQEVSTIFSKICK